MKPHEIFENHRFIKSKTNHKPGSWQALYNAPRATNATKTRTKRHNHQKRNKRTQCTKHTKITSVAILTQVALPSRASSFMSRMPEFDKHLRAVFVSKKRGEVSHMERRVNALNLECLSWSMVHEFGRAEATAIIFLSISRSVIPDYFSWVWTPTFKTSREGVPKL